MAVESEATSKVAFFVTRIGKPGSPVRDRTDHVGKFILEQPLKERGLRLLRADKDPGPTKITEKIVNNILDARIVIVDATGGNSNVFYELGLAHAFRKIVILLIDATEEIPFDVSNYTFIEIGDDGKIGAAEAESAAVEFGRSLDVVLAEGFSPSSPVTSAQRIAQLEESDNPSERGLADVLKKLDAMESEIRRISTSAVRAGTSSPTLSVKRLSSGFAISDRVGQSIEVTFEQVIKTFGGMMPRRVLSEWLNFEFSQGDWDMSHISERDIDRAASVVYRILEDKLSPRDGSD